VTLLPDFAVALVVQWRWRFLALDSALPVSLRTANGDAHQVAASYGNASSRRVQPRPELDSVEVVSGFGPALPTASTKLWSGRWESNPRLKLGKLSFYH
jgi:hypothetical protein